MVAQDRWCIYSVPRSGSWMVVDHIVAQLPSCSVHDGRWDTAPPESDSCVYKSHSALQPQSPSQWNCVVLHRRDWFHQWLSLALAVRTNEYRHYSDTVIQPFFIPPRVMIQGLNQQREREQDQLKLKDLPWHSFHTVYYEDLVADPHGVLTGILPGDVDVTLTPRSPRRVQDHISNYSQLQKTYKKWKHTHLLNTQ